MGLDDGYVPEPYHEQTTANTNAPWLDTGTPVDVDLDGLREYAKHMVDQQTDLLGRSMRLNHLSEMPYDAWDGEVLGEAKFVQSQCLANAKELTIYLQQLGQTMQNIGHAAQTVADSYGTADGTSAATLNSVLFAFGDKSVPRPDGLPPQIGQTYDERNREQGSDQPAPVDSPDWGPATSESTPFSTTVTSVHPNGQRLVIVTSRQPNSNTSYVTTTIYQGDRVLSQTRQTTTFGYDRSSESHTERTETTQNGVPTGTTETSRRIVDGDVVSETTTAYAPDAQGQDQERYTRTETVDEDGVRTDRTTRPDGDGGRETTDEVVIGAETEGQGLPQEPVADEYRPPLPGN